MTSTELCVQAINAANKPTLYVKGCIGAALKTSNYERYTTNNKYNNTDERKKLIYENLNKGVFGFDCVCFIKALLWGWNADVKATYGGAKYCSNGVPDLGTTELINSCANVSTDFTNIEPGEILYKSGHVGIYIGAGKAIECTPAWKNGVQMTAVGNIGTLKGLNTQSWLKHGKLKYVTYLGHICPLCGANVK